ncbi:MAG: hypothetical protein FRX49_09780 [Trebouxia sp. A1-2]|nr:MAG: hypothetical protein FRX49_09780 [Trebouxia sp. A1-2]
MGVAANTPPSATARIMRATPSSKRGAGCSNRAKRGSCSSLEQHPGLSYRQWRVGPPLRAARGAHTRHTDKKGGGEDGEEEKEGLLVLSQQSRYYRNGPTGEGSSPSRLVIQAPASSGRVPTDTPAREAGIALLDALVQEMDAVLHLEGPLQDWPSGLIQH